MVTKIKISTSGKGLHEISRQLGEIVKQSGTVSGLMTVFIQHTSASLTIQENADPSAKFDLEQWIERFVPEDDPNYTHTLEGSDDMPAHIKAALTSTSLSIPIVDSQLALGTWQGVYVWEHRYGKQLRSIAVHIGE